MVNFKTLGKSQCLFWLKCLVKRWHIVSVQVVADENYLLSIRILLIKKPLDFLGPVFSCPLLLGFRLPPSGKRLGEQEDAAGTVPYILVVFIPDACIFRYEPISCLCKQLYRLFVHTDDRDVGVIGTAVNFEDIFHRGNECGVVLCWDAPALF